MAIGAEVVDRVGDVEDVLEQRLESGVALAAAGAARIGLDRLAAVIEIVQDDRQILSQLGCVLSELVEVVDEWRAALTAGLPVSDAWPSERSEGSDSRENGVRSAKKRLRFTAARLRLLKTVDCASEAAPNLASAGRSCSRKAGSFFQVASMLGAWVAESREMLLAWTMKFWTCFELLASAVMTVLALAFRSRIVCASLANSASRLSVSASAGSARLSAS